MHDKIMAYFNLVPRVLSYLYSRGRDSPSPQGTSGRGPWKQGFAYKKRRLQKKSNIIIIIIIIIIIMKL